MSLSHSPCSFLSVWQNVQRRRFSCSCRHFGCFLSSTGYTSRVKMNLKCYLLLVVSWKKKKNWLLLFLLLYQTFFRYKWTLILQAWPQHNVKTYRDWKFSIDNLQTKNIGKNKWVLVDYNITIIHLLIKTKKTPADNGQCWYCFVLLSPFSMSTNAATVSYVINF